jgi:hypothetical protein
MSLSRFAAILLSPVLLASPAIVYAQAALPSVNDAAPEADEAPPHEGGWVHTIESDLIQEKFDDLDRIADRYRREKTRLSGGEWRLRRFYTALDAPQQTDKDSADHLAHLQNWTQQRSESITARVALATSLTRWAWVARGNGQANTVTPEGWRLFGERIQRAQSVLESSAKMRDMCPQWYSEMLTVGLAENWSADRMKDVFERGIQFEPDYFYLYRQYANYLLPKWDGKPGQAAEFAKSSADKVGGDVGDQVYYEIATVLIKRGDGDFPVHQMDWKRIQSGYQAVTLQYGASRRTKNEIAYMAYKFHDAAVARQQFDLIGDDWSRTVWRDRQYFDRARDWSQSHTSSSVRNVSPQLMLPTPTG